eukprot:7148299-Pyramimonas_sp.AAC.1
MPWPELRLQARHLLVQALDLVDAARVGREVADQHGDAREGRERADGRKEPANATAVHLEAVLRRPQQLISDGLLHVSSAIVAHQRMQTIGPARELQLKSPV